MSLNAMYTLLAILVLPTPQKEIPAVQNIDMVWNTLMSVIMFYKRMYMYRRMQKKVIVLKMGTDTSAVIHLSIPNWFLINFQYGIKWAYTAFSHQSSCGVISVGLCKWHSRAKISLLFNLAQSDIAVLVSVIIETESATTEIQKEVVLSNMLCCERDYFHSNHVFLKMTNKTANKTEHTQKKVTKLRHNNSVMISWMSDT